MNEGIYEVSVSELLKAVLKKWWIVAIALVLGALLLFAYTEYLVVPTYKTTARLGVHTTDDNTNAVGDANFGYVISRDCASVITGNVVLGNAADKLNEYPFEENGGNQYREYSAEVLAKMVSAESYTDSKFFTVSVTSIYPEEARIVAEKVIEAFCEGVSRDDLLAKGGAECKVVHRATTPESPISPNKTLNVLIGAALGVILSCVAIIIAHFSSNRLQSEEWLISNYGENIPLLAVIPDASSTEYRYDKKYYSSKSKK
jgi:capsular polysaccharide biosynthesis protein